MPGYHAHPGLRETLTRGARVADVACGTGHAVVLLAREFPRSTFTGYDLAEDAIARARAEAAAAGLTNANFEVRDVAELDRQRAAGCGVRLRLRFTTWLRPPQCCGASTMPCPAGGVFFMKEPRVSSDLADNIGNPFAPLLYAMSTLHCLTVSLAHNGAGLGTAWGEQVARQMLADAGFRDVVVHEAPADPMDAIFVTRKPAAR